jgi:hypothetical protein
MSNRRNGLGTLARGEGWQGIGQKQRKYSTIRYERSQKQGPKERTNGRSSCTEDNERLKDVEGLRITSKQLLCKCACLLVDSVHREGLLCCRM